MYVSIIVKGFLCGSGFSPVLGFFHVNHYVISCSFLHSLNPKELVLREGYNPSNVIIDPWKNTGTARENIEWMGDVI